MTDPDQIKKTINKYIELLPINMQSDYKIAMLSIELQELLYAECSKDKPEKAIMDSVKERRHALDEFISLRKETKEFFDKLTDQEQKNVSSKSRSLQKIIKAKKDSPNEQIQNGVSEDTSPI